MTIEVHEISKDAFVMLASQAPKEIPGWFMPEVEPFDQWRRRHPQSGECDQVRQRWYQEYSQKEKLLQWPSAYAKEVLKRMEHK